MNTRYWKLVINGSAGAHLMRTLDLAILLGCLGLAAAALAKHQINIAVLSLLLAIAMGVLCYLETRNARPPRPPPPDRQD